MERVVTAPSSFPRRRLLAMAGLLGLAGCAAPHLPPPAAFYGGPRSTPEFEPIPYASWAEDEPGYRLYPGDVLDIAVPSAPELARTVTVQPDGRITLPLIPQSMAADRSIVELQPAINRFIKETNGDPKPFTWTADPDKIIAAVRRGHQVLDSVH